MKYLTGYDIKGLLDNIISEKKQVQRTSFDLTAGTVYELNGSSRLDFGGSEYQQLDRVLLEPRKKNPEDQYGWWGLSHGLYLLKYNELITLQPNQRGIIQMHSRLLESGIIHPARIIEDVGELFMPINVLKKTNIKENARISELLIWEE
jgi:deoxycytidine triphosphate deaminase